MNDISADTKESIPQTITTRKIRQVDLAKVRPILETWIRDSQTGQVLTDEINEVLARIQGSINGDNQYGYLVAESPTQLLGIIGYRPPEGRVMEFTITDKPAEGINLYADSQIRG